MKLPSWTASHVEQYCDMIWKYIFMPASLVHFELAGSLRYATDVIPSAASGDDALSAPWTVDTWLETLFRYRVGFQPSLDEPAIACAANVGGVRLVRLLVDDHGARLGTQPGRQAVDVVHPVVVVLVQDADLGVRVV